jgi:hypothetical protein
MNVKNRNRAEIKLALNSPVYVVGSSYNSEEGTRVDQMNGDEYLNYGGPDQGSRLVWEDLQYTQDEKK